MNNDLIRVYTQVSQAEAWLRKYQGKNPVFACIFGFTETALIPGISAAGSTPEARKYTACADAEFLYFGVEHEFKYYLPPLNAGASPVFITRAIIEALNIPMYLFDAGSYEEAGSRGKGAGEYSLGSNGVAAVPMIDLGGTSAKCLSSGMAMTVETVLGLFRRGLDWGEKLANQNPDAYLVVGECVVGGTTTALAILTALGISAAGKVNSSHPVCNHQQKWEVVEMGIARMQARGIGLEGDPLEILAALGDPMQAVVAGMAIACSRKCGIMLGGGTQMLAVYALINAIAKFHNLAWQPEQIVVGTTRWVAEDQTGATVELAKLLEVTPPLLGTGLDFTRSRFTQLQAYEQGFVKEGVGAGAISIAAHLSHQWLQDDLLTNIESLLERYYTQISIAN
ncbi:nicotinate mononucleotide-dependent phosphoribosyltransferase CobT [Calothrix sp. PCC 6303]|uniref:nicotinate mononucleotide-dependent phosphoribosyltransferase CobT n=1 Tax=Calothrix sp. PCC 6303 TaxID=1170562 RepID=UPI0002A00C33|nr:TIGR00303 family protein [Calothrix sp. PCC 6303]AFZ03315.1 UPF0284 protein [Calothrix sp. PCC 6303]